MEVLIIGFAIYIVFIASQSIWDFLTNFRKRSLEKFLKQWEISSAAEYTSYQGYPPDWSIRRQIIFLRDNFTCQQCQTRFFPHFNGSWNWQEHFLSNPRNFRIGYFCRGAHVHHIEPISKGGNHLLDNLLLLCENCHSLQDGHQSLRKRINTHRYFRSYRYAEKIKQARYDYTCTVCENRIKVGQKYFGGKTYNKLCLNCYKRLYGQTN